MPNALVLVRHGESQWNRLNMFTGWQDVDLTEEGVAEAHRAGAMLKAEGARVLGDGEPKMGAHGKPVLFLHPKDFSGTLVELEQR